MLQPISQSLATTLTENAELRDLVEFLIKEANFYGKKGQSVSHVNVALIKKNYFALRFYDEAYIEWQENC